VISTRLIATFACLFGFAVFPSVASAQDKAKSSFDTAIDAYIYGYPLVTMEMSRRVATNVAEQTDQGGPMGVLSSARTYRDASYRGVTAPNADTLYSSAWMDVAKEPYILSIPDMKGRYFLMPVLDGWTNVFQVPGKRTTGAGAQKYAITGRNWKGKLPAGVKELKSPTDIVWLLGRIYCSGTPEDYKEVHAIQDELSLVPLSFYGKAYTAPAGTVDPKIDTKTAVRDQVNALSAEEYFKLLAELMKKDPPAAADAPMVAKMKKLGILPEDEGDVFDLKRLAPELNLKFGDVPKAANEKIMGHFKDAGTIENGWVFSIKTGLYGTDYLQRAFVTAIGLGANRPQDAVYPTSETNSEGTAYDGANKYVMHFEKGQFPPVDGFWSLTMYNAQYFFYGNTLNRYTLSQRNDLKPNADGSVDLLIQHDSPGSDKESNWLPSPAGKFILMLRMYWPTTTPPSIIDGTWKIPAVTTGSKNTA
jgi:hypothetical protein